ncbi:MAG: hypothetical protein P1V20_32075 [Verrucomicrobiales bacterium]|nr:hypothetical protein [Verrucomicrobiales bacterium]
MISIFACSAYTTMVLTPVYTRKVRMLPPIQMGFKVSHMETMDGMRYIRSIPVSD